MNICIDFESESIKFINTFDTFKFNTDNESSIKNLKSYLDFNMNKKTEEPIDPMPVLMIAAKSFKETLHSSSTDDEEKMCALKNFSKLSALFTVLISQDCKVYTIVRNYEKENIHLTICIDLY